VTKHNQFTFNKSLETDFKLFFKIIGIAFIPMVLILLQTDLGTTLVIFAIIIGVMIISGITWKILAPILIGSVVIASTVILSVIYKPSILENSFVIQPYHLLIIISCLDPYHY